MAYVASIGIGGPKT